MGMGGERGMGLGELRGAKRSVGTTYRSVLNTGDLARHDSILQLNCCVTLSMMIIVNSPMVKQ